MTKNDKITEENLLDDDQTENGAESEEHNVNVPDDEQNGGNLIRTIYDIFGDIELVSKCHFDGLVKRIQNKVKQLSDGWQCIEQRNIGIGYDIKLTRNKSK